MDNSSEIITIDVGGKLFRSCRMTLSKYFSKIKLCLEGKLQLPNWTECNMFLDVSWELFPHILDFMRYDQLMLPLDFKDTKRLRHLAEQIWLFDFVRAMDRDADTSDSDPQPIRYIQFQCKKTGDALSVAICCNPDVSRNLKLYDVFDKRLSSRVSSEQEARQSLTKLTDKIEEAGGYLVHPSDGNIDGCIKTEFPDWSVVFAVSKNKDSVPQSSLASGRGSNGSSGWKRPRGGSFNRGGGHEMSFGNNYYQGGY